MLMLKGQFCHWEKNCQSEDNITTMGEQQWQKQTGADCGWKIIETTSF
jgi:hypothetical protein